MIQMEDPTLAPSRIPPVQATVLAISLPQLCSRSVRALRRRLWSVSGDISYLSLFPLAPLCYLHGRIPRSALPLLPAPALPVVFGATVTAWQGSLYIPPPGEWTKGLLEAFTTAFPHLAITSTQDEADFPFQILAGGIYLGKDSPKAREAAKESTGELVVDDARLVCLTMHTSVGDTWDHHIAYQLLDDIRLTPGASSARQSPDSLHKPIDSTG